MNIIIINKIELQLFVQIVVKNVYGGCSVIFYMLNALLLYCIVVLFSVNYYYTTSPTTRPTATGLV